MAFNPYTPPTEVHSPAAGANPQIPNGGPQAWEPGETMGRAWEVFKSQWATLVFAPILAGIPANVVSQITTKFAFNEQDMERLGRQMGNGGQPDFLKIFAGAIPVLVITVLLTVLIQAFFQVGLIRIVLQAARGQFCQFGELLKGGPSFLSMLGVMFLKSVITLALPLTALGIAFGAGGVEALPVAMVVISVLMIPVIVISLGLSMAEFYVVDQGMGPVQALKASWSVTSGQKGKIFLLGLISVGVILLGYLACCIGVFAAMPTIQVANAMVYCALSGTIGYNAFQQYGGGYGGPPGGGYGGPPTGGGYGGPPAGGGYGGPPAGGGYGGPPGGYGGPPAGGGYGGPPAGGGYGGPGGGYGGPGY